MMLSLILSALLACAALGFHLGKRASKVKTPVQKIDTKIQSLDDIIEEIEKYQNPKNPHQNVIDMRAYKINKQLQKPKTIKKG